MTLQSGTRLGAYEIRSALGAGGMGEVYLARDSKLGRDVALKVLPERFAADADRLARFQREAQLLASLNHPHIGAIYGIEESQGRTALVLELIEGPTLGDRIADGPLSIDEALTIARQIAEALEAAHEKGVVHRDLKPANIKLTPDGKVKVLDFGLAKLVERDAIPSALSMSPTLGVEATFTGVILGSAGYMSPEQARGKTVDKRTDVWAFGCVLFEMLAGRKCFDVGDSVSDAVASVLKSEPDWARLPASTPAAVLRLLRRCLKKDPIDRLHDIGDARIEIDDVRSAAAEAPAAAPVTSHRDRLMLVSALVVAAILATLLGVSAFRPAVEAPEMRFEITTPPTTDPASFAISPDGKNLVFVATEDARSRLWLRSLESGVARSMAGTDDATQPFWSPDSRAIGFFAEGQLKRIDLAGGVQSLATAPIPRGGAWSPEGTILFTSSVTSPLLRIPAEGGAPVPALPLAPRQTSQRFPQFLPDGRHFLFYVVGPPEVRGIHVGELGREGSSRLLDADAAALYASPGYLLYVQQNSLFARAFDASGMMFTGDPFLLSQNVVVDGVSSNQAGVSVSASGAVVYRPDVGGGPRHFVWMDRSGKELGSVGEPHDGLGPSLSKDGERAAVYWSRNGNFDVWILELGRGAFTRLTSNATNELYPLWSPDGSQVVFSSNRNGIYDLYSRSANGGATDELVLTSPLAKNAMDWSSNGWLLYRDVSPATGYDLWAIDQNRVKGHAGQPVVVAKTEFEERDGVFSPDGRWVAYQSNESGRFEIYAQPFPGPGGRIQISTGGGGQVRWSPGGAEIFYVALDGRLMAVPIRLDGATNILVPGAPVPLFMTRIGGAVANNLRHQYNVAADGRFLMNNVLEEAPTPITVLLNWKGGRN